MFEKLDIAEQLERLKRKNRKEGDELVSEAHRILQQDLFAEKKILENLRQYRFQEEVLDEEVLDESQVFRVDEIKKVAILCRMKFLESSLFRAEIPYEAVLKIKHMEATYGKTLKHFNILSTSKSFHGKGEQDEAALFVKTNYDNYYLIHRWGKPLNRSRKWLYLPFRKFENLFVTVVIVTALITLILPTHWITLDSKAQYWSGYRLGTFFHLLIFDMGVTAYFTFAFGLNFNSSVWNRMKDFD